MTKLRYMLLVAFATIMTCGCASLVNGEYEALQAQIDELKQMVQSMNDDISSVKSVIDEIQAGACVKSCTEVKEGNVTVGYDLTFTDGRTIRITNGKDGRDGAPGAAGKDGAFPAIGLRQDTDGVWYWTLDGQWLTDEAGSRVRASGGQGSQGEPGASGKDGITPMLKIEDNWWYISYDGGIIWTRLSEARGKDGAGGTDGKDGKDGKDGTTFFKDITISDDYVVLTMADGTKISIPQYKPLTLTLSSKSVTMTAGTTKAITYEIGGNTANCTVFANSTSENWILTVTRTSATKGTVSITAPAFGETTDIAVFAGNGTTTVMEVITATATN